MKLYNNDGPEYGDYVIEFFMESFSVLKKTTDCTSYPCQAQACGAATRANIDTSCCMNTMKGSFVAKQIAKPMIKTILRMPQVAILVVTR